MPNFLTGAPNQTLVKNAEAMLVTGFVRNCGCNTDNKSPLVGTGSRTHTANGYALLPVENLAANVRPKFLRFIGDGVDGELGFQGVKRVR